MKDNNDNGTGHVRIYYMNDTSSSWKKIGQDINGESDYDQSGYSVSLSADGKSVAIGSIFNGNDGKSEGTGHVRVFNLDSS